MFRAWALVTLVFLAALGGGCGAGGRGRISPAPRPIAHSQVRQRGRSAARELQLLRRIGLPVFCGGRRRRLVALTFDDGPGPYTGLALRRLRRAHAHATFFLVGRSIVRFPAWPRRELAVGALGDHTATHADLGALDAAGVRREIYGGRLAIDEAGAGKVELFRPPYGVHDAAIDREVRRQGLVEVLWDVDSGDSDVLHHYDFHAISAIVRRNVRPGSIVLMHENRGQTIRALRAILPWLRRHRLRPVSVPTLLAADPPTLAQLRAGHAGCGTGPPRRSAS